MTMLHMATNLISEHGDMLLYFVSISSVLCGMSVLVFINHIASILSLIGLFISISAYLILIGYHFFALVHLVVDIGAISILFLFIIMLISVCFFGFCLVNSVGVVIGGTKPLPLPHIPELVGTDIQNLAALYALWFGKIMWDNRPEIALDLVPTNILVEGVTYRAVAYIGDNWVAIIIFRFLFLGDPRLTFTTNSCTVDGNLYPTYYANNRNNYPPFSCVTISPAFINDGVLDYHISTLFPSPVRTNWLLILGILRLKLTTGYDAYEIEIRPTLFNLFSMELRSYNSINREVTIEYLG